MSRRLEELHLQVVADDGRRSTIWLIWVHAKSGDIYCIARNRFGLFKFSLHDRKVCRIGITSEFIEKQKEANKAIYARCSWDKWELLDNAGEGVAVPLRIRVFPEHLSNCSEKTPSDSKAIALRAPSPGSIGEIVLMCLRGKAAEHRNVKFNSPTAQVLSDVAIGHDFKLLVLYHIMIDDGLLTEAMRVIPEQALNRPLTWASGEGSLPTESTTCLAGNVLPDQSRVWVELNLSEIFPTGKLSVKRQVNESHGDTN